MTRDESDEFDESSDEEMVDGDNSGLATGSSVTFLLGTRSRFGRVVRFNNRFLQ